MYIIWCSFLNLTSFDFICIVGVALASHLAIQFPPKLCKRHKETLTSLELASCTVHGLLRNDAFLTLLATQRGLQSCVLRRSLRSLALADELRSLRPEVVAGISMVPQ
jgi:hypothetical protein